MHLLEGIPVEVYNAYFPQSVVESSALTSSSTRVYPRPNYFPQGPGIICAEPLAALGPRLAWGPATYNAHGGPSRGFLLMLL